MKLYWTEENKKKAQELVRIAREMGVTAAQLSIAWILRRSEVTSVILGASRVEQLRENFKAAEIRIPDEVVARLDALFPPPEEVPGIL